MEPAVFEKHVLALATKRLEKPKKLSVQNGRYLGEIMTQQYNFERGMTQCRIGYNLFIQGSGVTRIGWAP